MEVDYALQELDAGIGNHKIPQGRIKPWGTGHAILMAKELINEPFAAINADDFYGYDSFKVMADFLSEAKPSGSYAMVGFPLKNTLSENGSVSRGICQCDANGFMKKVVEHTKIFSEGESIIAEMEDGSRKKMQANDMTSMNFWGFQTGLFIHLEEQFAKFLEEKGNELKSEFYIPFVVDRLISESKASVKVVPTSESWFGVTYQEDKPLVKQSISELIDGRKYPAKLWEKK